MSQPLSPSITIGVDTHKASHAAVAITNFLGSTTITATAKGYRDLEAWAKSLGCINAFGIEGIRGP
jgi:transposase